MPYCPILATLAYVLSPDGRQVLLIHRNARDTDEHLGKYNGLGGKVEDDEDVVASVRREVMEEAGIVCEKISLRGSISWPFFGRNGEHWYGLVFLVEQFSGTPFTRNPEGDLCWVDVDKIMELPMWDGDRQFLPLVFDGDPRQFHGVMPYENGKMKSWTYSRI
ncbi:8-oxo-dGTP diphosphatase [Arenimonas sp. GDDSR-1]|uniref:NUDIX hydrolase n=1 Tax=Arenimonas sp. GDDSR-1 TaxID=2950125 RepID=UPI002624307F|nr:8-oxo-dGTP diphosphatase [Arenimonas sp. GDDSR-1]